VIIARSPLRITLGGGGTDLPSYYREHEGFLVAAAIDKYVYVTVTRPFTEGIFLKYSEIEKCERVEQVRHPIVRECLKLLNLKTPQIEITTLADIPSGTGLGSSGSFTTALLKALYAHRKKHIHPKELAELACLIEIEKLGEPIGKQDQYAAAIGGVTCFHFMQDDKVISEPLSINIDDLHALEDHLMLFFTGFSRSASSILKDQDLRTKSSEKEMVANLHFVKEIGLESKRALETGDLIGFGRLLHEHWTHKKMRTKGMTNTQIDQWYQLARDSGAIGGKVVGAGGGGFLMLLTENKPRLRAAMKASGLEEVRFRFDFTGTVLGNQA
jgi:D-glycero-alpha-D-manno-heptose-7-phosphate kinase